MIMFKIKSMKFWISSYTLERNMKKHFVVSLLALLIVGLFAATGSIIREAEAKSLTKATFYVH